MVVPVKPLGAAKSRLRGAADQGIGEPSAHARLALARAHDTGAAVRGAVRVGRLVVVSSDPLVAAELAAVGVEVVPDGPAAGLNEAYRHGARLLGSARPVAALQADLPALLPAEMDAALAAAWAVFAGGAAAAFCADAAGSGTTLLVAAPGRELDPLFGIDSAARHRAAGAVELVGDWPGLRRDVDTADDLRAAAELGLGAHTRCVLAPSTPGC
ncbi:MAG: 2-phospho-L-lactate guanylyltransferase [Pseudonocardia sp.]|nr:2-phospho-L-lactate guanylyltransferase [Pseudonocardia sp.]